MPQPARARKDELDQLEIPLSTNLIRELLEEYRHGTQEVLGLRNDMVNLQRAMEENTRIIRGSNGEHGIITKFALMEEGLRGLNSQLIGLIREGTPASQKDLHQLTIIIKALEAGQISNITRLGQLEAESNDEKTRMITGGWQLILWISGQAIAIALALGAILTVILKH